MSPLAIKIHPLIGKAKYRGYFNEKLARQQAADLKREGIDVCLDGVRVYSTPGGFADPVLDSDRKVCG